MNLNLTTSGIFERVFDSDFQLRVLSTTKDETQMKELHQICEVEVIMARSVERDITRKPGYNKDKIINGASCGTVGPPPATFEKILGGRETIPHKYPWMVLLLKISESGK